MIIARIRRYPVVIHCTVEVPMPNSSIRVGKVTFMAVSTTTPEKDMIPAAMMEKISFASIFFSDSFIFFYFLSFFLVGGNIQIFHDLQYPVNGICGCREIFRRNVLEITRQPGVISSYIKIIVFLP